MKLAHGERRRETGDGWPAPVWCGEQDERKERPRPVCAEQEVLVAPIQTTAATLWRRSYGQRAYGAEVGW
jgi:hypothetical protein